MRQSPTLRSQLWTVLAIFTLLVACSQSNPSPSAANLPSTLTLPVVLTDIPLRNTTTPTKDPINHIQASMILPKGTLINGWSADSQWLAYTVLPSEVHVASVTTGQTCLVVDQSRQAYERTLWAWLADGRLLIVDPETLQVSAGLPCTDLAKREVIDTIPGLVRSIMAHSPDHHYLGIATTKGFIIYDSLTNVVQPSEDPLHGDEYTWSPEGSYLAVTGWLSRASPDGDTMYTLVVEAATGKTIQTVKWIQRSRYPSMNGPLWVGEDYLIFSQTGEKEGPLLLPIQGALISILPDLFGKDCTVTPCQEGDVRGMTQANGQLHLLYAEWWDTESAYTETTLFLYHHETGETESLPNWTEGSFSPDGEQLLLVRPIFPTAPAFDFGLRPVEPRSADILPLAIPSEAVAYWQPDSQHIVVSEIDRLSLYHLPDVLLLNTWITDTTMGLPYFHDLQSPDGRRLLARGYYSNPEDMPLYVITVPSS